MSSQCTSLHSALASIRCDSHVACTSVLTCAQPPNPICSLGARCVRSAATITCHSCDNIEGGCSRYCQNCFNAYHPWYRSTHRWSRLGDVQGVTNELLGHVHRADIERNIADLQGLLKITSVWQRGLDTQNLDTKVRSCPVPLPIKGKSSPSPKWRCFEKYAPFTVSPIQKCGCTLLTRASLNTCSQGDDLIKEAARDASRIRVKIRYLVR